MRENHLARTAATAVAIVMLGLSSTSCKGATTGRGASTGEQAMVSSKGPVKDSFFLQGTLYKGDRRRAASGYDEIPLEVRVFSDGRAVSRPASTWRNRSVIGGGEFKGLSFGDGTRFWGRYDSGAKRLAGRLTIEVTQTGATTGKKTSSSSSYLGYEFAGSLVARSRTIRVPKYDTDPSSRTKTASKPKPTSWETHEVFSAKIAGTATWVRKRPDGKTVRRQGKDTWDFHAEREGPWRNDSCHLEITVPGLKALDANFWANARAPRSPVVERGNSAVDLRANHPGRGQIDVSIGIDGDSRMAEGGSGRFTMGTLVMKEGDLYRFAGTYNGKTRRLTGHLKVRLTYVEMERRKLVVDARCLLDGEVDGRFVSDTVMKGRIRGVAVFPTKDSSGKVVKRVRRSYSWPFTAVSNRLMTAVK